MPSRKNTSTSEPLRRSPSPSDATVNQLLRDFESLRRLYEADPALRARIDASVEERKTLAEREHWAAQLGIAATDSDSIIAALAERLGAKAARSSSPKPPAAVLATAKGRAGGRSIKRTDAPRAPAKPGGRRTKVDSTDIQTKILNALQGGTTRGEELRKQIGLPPKSLWKHATDALLDSKRIKKSGDRRKTEYRLP